MNRALKYNDGHICKRNYTQVAMFYFTSVHQTQTQIFRALVQFDIKIAPISADEDRSVEEKYNYVIDILEDKKSKFFQVT